MLHRAVPAAGDPGPVGNPDSGRGAVCANATDLSRFRDGWHCCTGALPDATGTGASSSRREPFGGRSARPVRHHNSPLNISSRLEHPKYLASHFETYLLRFPRADNTTQPEIWSWARGFQNDRCHRSCVLPAFISLTTTPGRKQ